MERRRTVSKSRSQMKDDRDLERGPSGGVNGRNITVMHHTTRANGLTNDGMEFSRPMNTSGLEKPNDGQAQDQMESSGSSEETIPKEQAEDAVSPHTQITFASQVKRSDGMQDEALRLPTQRTDADHIAFLERQRNPDDRGVLRIPNPRDADRGMAPETVDEEYDGRRRRMSGQSSVKPARRGSNQSEMPQRMIGDDHAIDDEEEEDRPRRRNIRIAEPSRPPTAASSRAADDARAAAHTLGALRLRRPRLLHGEKLHEESHQFDRQNRNRSATFSSFKTALSRDKDETAPYLSWQPTIGRNSAFVDLTEEQREELGGIEYRSLKSLALILVVYFVGFELLALVSLLPWILGSSTYKAVLHANGISPTWWGIFTANSAFTDLGFTLTPDSMISFGSAVWPLLVMSFLIIVGNTGFPIMLRFVIWVTTTYLPKGSGMWEELQFLLDHPRRCFTLLFPSAATWWLFLILVVLNAVDLVFFIILDVGSPFHLLNLNSSLTSAKLGNTIVTTLPVHVRVLDGWFQAVSTRTAGFGVVNLLSLHPAIQVSYMVMMYISVLPIAISVRRTNVYEEKSLGIYGTAAEDEADEAEGEPSYVGAHLRRQLSFDLWFIFLGLFIIAIVEGSPLQSGNPNFTLFTVLFEIVSAYGTVGLSLGYPTINTSFSGELSVISKLVIIAMQIRGRHRGLPYELDRAILLPSESLHEKENNDPVNRQRRNSMTTIATGQDDGPRRGSEETERRSISRRGTQVNFLSALLHAGPTMPNSHRHLKNPSLELKQTSSPSEGRPFQSRTTGAPYHSSSDDDAFASGARPNGEGLWAKPHE